jgi:hypothetical protein
VLGKSSQLLRKSSCLVLEVHLYVYARVTYQFLLDKCPHFSWFNTTLWLLNLQQTRFPNGLLYLYPRVNLDLRRLHILYVYILHTPFCEISVTHVYTCICNYDISICYINHYVMHIYMIYINCMSIYAYICIYEYLYITSIIL